MALAPGAAEPRIVAERYLGDRIGVAGQTVVFDQMEIAANVGLQRDLYAVTPPAARAGAPDARPACRRSRCVAGWTHGGVHEPARRPPRPLDAPLLHTAPTLSIGADRVLASAPDTEFTAPRWSPDGRWIAVERRVRGALPAIVHRRRRERRDQGRRRIRDCAMRHAGVAA